MGRVDDIMCDNIICEDLYFSSMAAINDITCHGLTYNDLNLECVRL